MERALKTPVRRDEDRWCGTFEEPTADALGSSLTKEFQQLNLVVAAIMHVLYAKIAADGTQPPQVKTLLDYAWTVNSYKRYDKLVSMVKKWANPANTLTLDVSSTAGLTINAPNATTIMVIMQQPQVVGRLLPSGQPIPPLALGATTMTRPEIWYRLMNRICK